MKSITPKEIIQLLEKKGFELKKTKGSHQIFKHPDGRRTVVPVHNKDLPKGTVLAILKQSGISKEEI